MSVKLRDKVVIITGASSGFGRGAATLFAQEGAKVVLAARRLKRLQDLEKDIQDQGADALAISVDITQRGEIDAMVANVLENYDRIDILFNNAGFGRLDWLEDLDPERDIEAQIQVNLNGLIHVTRAVLPQMINQRGGHIINMSSIAGWLAAPTYTIYAASKYGVRGFTTALRREVAPFDIKVSGIYPGPASTEFSQRTRDGAKAKRPRWSNMFYIPSEAVSRRVIKLAKHPRRKVILPWWFALLALGENHFPGVADFLVRTIYTDKNRNQENP